LGAGGGTVTVAFHPEAKGASMDWLQNQTVGVVIGAIVATMGTYVLEWRKEREANAATRTMLGKDTTLVAEILRDLAVQLPTIPEPEENEGPEDRASRINLYYTNRAEALIDFPLPAWRTTMWESQRGEIARALKPDELEVASSLFVNLDRIASLRESLAYALNDDREHRRFRREQFLPIFAVMFQKRIDQRRSDLDNIVTEALGQAERVSEMMR
jgi:hypothetical protein